MTYLEVAYRYQTPPGEAELRAVDSVREVYGIQRIQFNEKERTVRVRSPDVVVSRLARGLPVGGELEYADGETIAQALSARRQFPGA